MAEEEMFVARGGGELFGDKQSLDGMRPALAVVRALRQEAFYDRAIGSAKENNLALSPSRQFRAKNSIDEAFHQLDDIH